MAPADDFSDCEAACTRLCIAFANLIDARDYSAFANLFTADALWVRPDRTMRGRTDILAYLQARSTQTVTRHICSNIQITPVSENEATGLSYVMYFNGSQGVAGEPAATALPLIGDYRDVYVRVPNEGWRIRERRIQVVFAP